jgi:hypothetical protein
MRTYVRLLACSELPTPTARVRVDWRPASADLLGMELRDELDCLRHEMTELTARLDDLEARIVTVSRRGKTRQKTAPQEPVHSYVVDDADLWP